MRDAVVGVVEALDGLFELAVFDAFEDFERGDGTLFFLLVFGGEDVFFVECTCINFVFEAQFLIFSAILFVYTEENSDCSDGDEDDEADGEVEGVAAFVEGVGVSELCECIDTLRLNVALLSEQ